MNELLRRYTVAVEHPDVSGFEHLEMLMIRDKLAGQAASLSPYECKCLALADRRLIAQAAAFHTALSRITSLQYERRQRDVSPSRWWWYLDVLVHFPQPVPEPVLA